jgi:hypothetical protein
MKTTLLIILLFNSFTVFSQDLPCKEKYYNGRCKQRYLEDVEGKIHGKFISYFEDGTVDEVAHYSHGKYHGLVTEFTAWGKIMTNYLNGVEHGLYQKLKSDGSIMEKGNYTNGVKTGYWIEYDGQDKGNYVNGQKHGQWEIYRQGWDGNGGITKGTFENGEHIGVWLNLVVIGVKNPSALEMYSKKEIAIPATAGYDSLKEYFKEGYKAVFKDGYYVEAYDSNGTPIKAP